MQCLTGTRSGTVARLEDVGDGVRQREREPERRGEPYVADLCGNLQPRMPSGCRAASVHVAAVAGREVAARYWARLVGEGVFVSVCRCLCVVSVRMRRFLSDAPPEEHPSC